MTYEAAADSNTGHQIVRIGETGEKERRRRRFELSAALVLLLVAVGGTWTQLTFYGVDSWIFIVLFNVNSIFMLIILFLVARNVVKLIMERRRQVFGARLRTRLVLVFVSLSLVPTVIMFLASNRVVGRSVDYWFTHRTESALQAALEVGQSFYAASAKRLRARSEAIIREILERRSAWGGTDMNTLLERKRKEYGLTLVGAVSPKGIERNWHAPANFNNVWHSTRSRINWEHVASNTFGSLLWTGEEADFVIGILAVDGGRTGYLVAAESIGEGLMAKLDGIARGFDEYAQLKQLKKPLKVSFQLILGVLGMITIFGSVWFGFRLSKEMSAPILALADGTTRIAKGDLNFRLEDKGLDELGQLVRSFNMMAEDLQEGRESLTRANALLGRQNEKVAERNLYIETVLDNITTGVVTLDARGRLLTMNKAAALIFDTEPALLQGRNPAAFLPQAYEFDFNTMLATLRAHPEHHWQRQVDFSIGDRSWKLIVHAVALQRGDEIQAFVVVIEDITELEKMQRMTAWREVARRIAHEIKNPLTPIKLSAQRLERKFGSQVNDPALTQCTDLIVRQVERLQEMVKEFSAFAKLPEVTLSPGNLEPLLTELATLFAAGHNKIAWQTEIQAELPRIALDQDALHRALLNVLTNATEVLEGREHGIVRISAAYESARGIVRVGVEDSGPGLTAEERRRLFEPYFSRKKGGTGLGLTIVKSVVADHRGTIRVTGSDLGGTAVILEFPEYRS